MSTLRLLARGLIIIHLNLGIKMINNTFYTTVDKNRLQIADENSYYGGSLNSYNNFLSRLFAKVFRKSMTVNFDGNKEFKVNKKSYQKLLQNNGVNAKNIANFTDFNRVMKDHKQAWNRNGYIRNHLSRSKSHRLFKKLVYALQNRNMNKAHQLACKGANIERDFWERDNGYGISFNQITTNLPKQTLQFTATRYNPILYAAKNNLNHFVNFLVKIGSSTNFVGETARFNRVITHVENQYHVEPRLVPVYRYNRHARRQQVQYVPYPEVRRETIVHYRDAKNKLYDHFLDANLHFVSQVAP